MENTEAREQRENYIATIKEDIENAPANIAAEIERGSGNNWLSALVSRITTVSGFAQMAEVKGQLSREKSEKIQSITDAMMVEIDAYQKNPDVANNPPEEVKSALLAELRSALEVL